MPSAYIGKDTALAFDAGLAFGLSARQHNAWVHAAAALRFEMYKKYGIVNFTCGNVGVQALSARKSRAWPTRRA